MVPYTSNKKHGLMQALEFNLKRMTTYSVPDAADPAEEASEIQRLFNEPVAQRMKTLAA